MTQYFVKKVLCLQQKAEKKAPHATAEAQTMRKTFVIKNKKQIETPIKPLSIPLLLPHLQLDLPCRQVYPLYWLYTCKH